MRETKKVILIEKCDNSERVTTLDAVDAHTNPCVKQLVFTDGNEQRQEQTCNVGGKFPTDKQDWILPPFEATGYSLSKNTYIPSYKVTVDGITYYRANVPVYKLYEQTEGHWTFPSSTDTAKQILKDKGIYQTPDEYDLNWTEPTYYVENVFTEETLGVDYYIALNIVTSEFSDSDEFTLISVELENGTHKTYDTATERTGRGFHNTLIIMDMKFHDVSDFVEYQNDLAQIRKVILKQTSGGNDTLEFTSFSFDLFLINDMWLGGTRYVPKENVEKVYRLKHEVTNLWSSSFKIAEPQSTVNVQDAPIHGIYLLTTDTQAKVVRDGSLVDGMSMEGMEALWVTDMVVDNEVTYLGRANNYLIPQDKLVLGTYGTYYVTGTDVEPITCTYKFTYDGKNYYAQADFGTWNTIYEEDGSIVQNHFHDADHISTNDDEPDFGGVSSDTPLDE